MKTKTNPFEPVKSHFNAEEVELLLKIGGKLWEPKEGMKRIYFNQPASYDKPRKLWYDYSTDCFHFSGMNHSTADRLVGELAKRMDEYLYLND